jgi:RND family efflux transporter MFP subunit
MSLRKLWPALLPLLLLSSACDKKEPAPAAQWLPVRVQPVAPPGDDYGARYSASVTPLTQVNLSFKVNGYVDAIYQIKDSEGKLRPISRGETVTTDTVLAHINDVEYVDQVKAAEASLAAAKASLLKAQQDFKRAKNLYATESMTAPDFDSAQQQYGTAVANVDSARAQLDEARQNLAWCTMKPPLDGVVLNRNIEVGTLVAQDKVAFVVADMTSVKVVFTVPDVMLKNAALGDILSVTTQSQPGKTYSGNVTTISPVADTRTRLFEIEITIPNPQGELKDGMVAALQVPELPAHTVATVSVPVGAVVRSKSDPQAYAVYVIDNQDGKTVARLQDVQLGEVHGNRIVVNDGIDSGQEVIVNGVSTVWDGSVVRVLP